MFKFTFSSTTNNIANNNNNNVTTSNGHSDSSKINPYNEKLVANPELNSTIDDFQSISNINPNFSSSLEPIFRTEEDESETISYNGTNLLLFPQNNQNADADTDIAMEEFIKFKDPLALDNNHDAVQQIEDETENIKDTAIEEEITEASTQEKERFPQMPADVKFEIEQDNSVENEANFRNFFSQYRASLNLLYERH